MADQGAYTCEAMNSEGSVLATPDAIVNVIESGNTIHLILQNKSLIKSNDAGWTDFTKIIK